MYTYKGVNFPYIWTFGGVEYMIIPDGDTANLKGGHYMIYYSDTDHYGNDFTNMWRKMTGYNGGIIILRKEKYVR